MRNDQIDHIPSVTRIRFLLAGIILNLLVISSAAAASHVVTLGVPPWPGINIKSTVVSQILKPLGYTIKESKTSAPIVYLSLSKGKDDINMSAWWPGQSSSFEKYIKKGKVVKLGSNLTGAVSGFAVPHYVYKTGFTSDTQIKQHMNRIHHEVHCLEPGSGANNVVNKAIKNNTYGLKNLKIKKSSTAAMLAEVKHKIQKHKWIMFCGWKPHWMNIVYNMNILKDPKSLWGPNHGHSKVFTLASKSFVKNNPNLVKFFRHFQIKSSTQSKWIYKSSYKKQPKKQVADHWISNHLDEVSQWLKGVKTAHGHNAVQALKSRYGND